MTLTASDGAVLLKAARSAIENKVTKKEARPVAAIGRFDKHAGIFVTIHKGGFLRGCMGLPYPTMPLSEALLEAAARACSDPRFAPLTADELARISIEISVLSPPKEMEVSGTDELLSSLTHEHGLIIQKGSRGALFLPQVWKTFPRPEDFLSQLCCKAGLTPDAWTERGCKFWRFNAQVFNEQK